MADIGTDLYLAVGKLKDTNRYKEADKTLKAAKQKYNPETTSVAGHSLGGSIASYAASKNDKVTTLDKGATIAQKTRSNEQALRTQGDIVSLLNANSKHMTTLKNPNYRTGVRVYDALNAHNVSNIKDSGILI
jgi:dienelactone hydrolase